MAVVVKFSGRLGNNLFQYALGRIVARELGLALECRSPVSRPWQLSGVDLDVGESSTLSALGSYFPNAPLRMPGSSIDTPQEWFETDPASEWDGQTIDLNEICRNRTLRQISLAGWFQRFEYYAPHQDSIRQWLRTPVLPHGFIIGKNDVMISVRRGADYGMKSWVLPLSYYAEALSSLRNSSQIYVCGIGIDQNLRSFLAERRPIYFEGSAIEQFCFSKLFHRMILSNSTFSWWSAFLSEAEEIVAPRSATGNLYAFTGFPGVDLHMRKPQYREINVLEGVSCTVFARNPQALVQKYGKTNFRIMNTVSGSLITLETDGRNRDLIEWLAKQHGPVPTGEARRRWGPELLDLTLPDAVRCGLLWISPQYQDREFHRRSGTEMSGTSLKSDV